MQCSITHSTKRTTLISGGIYAAVTTLPKTTMRARVCMGQKPRKIRYIYIYFIHPYSSTHLLDTLILTLA